MVPGTQINMSGFTHPRVMGDWRGSVDVRALAAESRRAIMEAVRFKLGWSGAPAALGISRAALSSRSPTSWTITE